MIFSKKLILWYLQNKRDLPWRKTKNPYFVWLSEIMLQQTRVTQGLPYFLAFTNEFPTVFHLAKAPESKVLKMWQGLGYYSRARNLHATAKFIAKELNGVFPNNYNDIIKLKGVGDYTASAISSICFNEPKAVVDGNVYRVLSRYFGIETAINSTQGIKEFKELANTLLDTTKPGTYNQAIMDFGAIQCKPKKPLCMFCPFNKSCVALQKNKIDMLPVKEKKLKIKKRHFNYLVVKTETNTTILTKRNGKGIWQGLYEFPNIESNKSLDFSELIQTKNFKELVTKDSVINLFNKKEIVHKLSHQHIHTQFWIVETKTHEKATISWTDVNNYPVPILIANFLAQFLTRNN